MGGSVFQNGGGRQSLGYANQPSAPMPSSGSNVFQQGSQAYRQGLDYTSQAGGPNAGMDAAGGMLAGYGASPDAGAARASNMLSGYAGNPTNSMMNSGAQGLGGANGYQQQAAGGYGQSVDPTTVRRTMNQYLNPYQSQVVDQTMTRMGQQRNDDLNMVRGQAAQSGAYGGARQGLVEAELMGRYNQNMYDTAGALNQQGFNQAATLGQNSTAQMQNAAQGFAGLGGQRLSADQALLSGGLNARGQQINAAQGAGQLSLNSRGQQINAAQGLGQLGQAQAGNQLAAGQGLMAGAAQGQNMGMAALNQQNQAGMQQQQMNQRILDQATGQYDQYSNYPQTALATALAALQGNPLGAQNTTTQTTTPGMFDYLSLGAGMGSSYLGGKGGGR